MREEFRERIIKEQVYIAEDGSEFAFYSDCLEYERKNRKDKIEEAAEKLRITELDDLVPLTSSGDVHYENTFCWYRLNSREDFEKVNAAYKDALYEPENYPEIMCVEIVENYEYEDDGYDCSLSRCKKETIDFWKKFGYEVEFKKVGEIL